MSSPLPLLSALLLVGCTPEPGPVALYLRQGRPGPAVRFGRVDVNSNDFGSLSTEPPAAGEDRSCGSVVAFGAAEGLVRPDTLHVREVLYQLWWYAGSGRGQLGLNAPGLPGPFASLPVVASGLLAGNAPRGAGYSLAQARLPVDLELSGEQLDGLYLSLDVGGASVKVASCAAAPSLVILNPSPAFDAGAWSQAPSCLPPNLALELPSVDAIPAPTWERELEQGGVVESLALEGEAVLHRGDLEVRGELTLVGARLVLAPDGAGAPPRVLLRPGASLRLSAGAELTAQGPLTGFHLRAEPGSRVEILDSAVRWGGFLRLGDDGRVLPTEVALDLETADVVLRGSRFEGNIVALRLSGGGALIEGNAFARNATAIEARGAGGRVVDNHSYGDGLFLRLDHRSAGWQVLDNTLSYSLDMALWLDGDGAQHTVRGNAIVDANAGIAVTERGDYAVIEDNRVRTCRYPIVRHGAEPDPAILARNLLEQSAFEGCPPEPD